MVGVDLGSEVGEGGSEWSVTKETTVPGRWSSFIASPIIPV